MRTSGALTEFAQCVLRALAAQRDVVRETLEHVSMHVVYCVLHVVYCVLRVVYCVLRVACCVLRVACCVLRVACKYWLIGGDNKLAAERKSRKCSS
jgi:hypothetical protein